MTDSDLDLSAPLLIGLGIANQAVAEALVARGHRCVVAEDRPTEAHREVAGRLGLDLVEAPDRAELERLVAAATVVLPSPGIPDHHRVFAVAAEAGLAVASEFDLAQRWDDRPVAAITGTNGKTTVTMMVADALNRSGRSAAPVGNTEVPYVASIDDPETEVFVVEASSFRLAHSSSFRPDVAAWLNFAPDHLDAHASLEAYRDAKASIWAGSRSGSSGPSPFVIANADDPVVMGHVPTSAERVWTFSISDTHADWHVDNDTTDGSGPRLVGPDGPFIECRQLVRGQPHDLSNALATAAIASAIGADMDGIVATLRSFSGLAHRLEKLGSRDGVTWYNDSKATVPHATVAAVGGFQSVVLIAGGKGKGLSFEPLRSTVPPVRAVVAIGSSAAEVEAVYADRVPVTGADSMRQAVLEAHRLAEPGDAVVLSPACASFDWYPNYVERGLDFSALVRQLIDGQPVEAEVETP
jgi:UDP-N-acetylmuramoylalanine--D-glutamate ligase